ncbi:MAG: hypothetical protein BWX92_04026 [Deltaproteobacteria bacterium ADurb.Bin135]|nr:MAG: hypothetical protein BWX92_04026 [Deltaproteobacteria bacterium ADurb.Bin135]
METAISTLSVLPSNRDQIKSFSRQLKDEIMGGSLDPLKTLVHLKFIEKMLADILKDEELDELFIRELALYGNEKVVEIAGAKLSLMEAGTRYDYEASGDPKWFDLKKESTEASERLKEREKFLQTIPYDAGVVDPDTGVFITRPPKTSKTKVKCVL